MKLLLDQNLSRNLTGRSRDVWPESVHVSALGLATVSDRAIWDYAAGHGYVIVSKDSDFRQLAFLHGPPPKVIWLRVGNATTIRAFGDSADEAFLVLSGAALGQPPGAP